MTQVTLWRVFTAVSSFNVTQYLSMTYRYCAKHSCGICGPTNGRRCGSAGTARRRRTERQRSSKRPQAEEEHTALNDRAMERLSMSDQTVASTAASHVSRPSMVAMLGWIIPLPFAMPPRVTVVPSSCISSAQLLHTRSAHHVTTYALLTRPQVRQQHDKHVPSEKATQHLQLGSLTAVRSKHATCTWEHSCWCRAYQWS